ncbi:VOC family protein, partial [Rhizobium ruizarguesonis]
IYVTCQNLMDYGVTINRPPRDWNMAFVRSPDGISIDILQKGSPLPAAAPWASMGKTGAWYGFSPQGFCEACGFFAFGSG